MTPKEKAQQLFYKYNSQTSDEFKSDTFKSAKIAQQCALIAVDEMIIQNGELYLNSLGDKMIKFYIEKNAYLFELKQEIENL